MEGDSSPASQEGLGQLRGAAQLTTSQLSSAPLQSLVHHCNHHCTDCAGAWTVTVSTQVSDRKTDRSVIVTVTSGKGWPLCEDDRRVYIRKLYVPWADKQHVFGNWVHYGI